MLVPFIAAHLRRFVRSRRSLALAIGWFAFAAVIGLSAGAKSTGLRGALSVSFVGSTLPFLSYAAISGVVGEKGLGATVWSFSLMGCSRRRAALSLLAAALALGALLGLASAALVSVLGHSAMDPPLGRDLLTTMWVGALGGAAYASLFLLGSSFWKGAGRGVLLAMDWVLGGSGFFALLFPHGHLRSLFGGDPAFDVSQRVSSMLLVLLTVLMGAWAVRRAMRAS